MLLLYLKLMQKYKQTEKEGILFTFRVDGPICSNLDNTNMLNLYPVAFFRGGCKWWYSRHEIILREGKGGP